MPSHPTLPTGTPCDAKARFSELLDTCLRDGPQIVTRRGQEAAVLVPVAEWRRVQDNGRPSLKAFLLADGLRFELDIPARGQRSRREPPDLS